MVERRGPDEGSEDLFEDLDKFFQSVGEDDWPEPIVTIPSPEPQASAAVPPQGAAPEEPEPTAASEPEPAPDAPEEAHPAAAAVEAGSGPADEGPLPVERGGEMSPADWSRLRDVLREEDDDGDEPVLDYPGREETTEESLFGYPGAGKEEEPAAMSGWETGGPGWTDDDDEEPGSTEREPEHELTVDDLRKAPPQYRDLPGPRDPDAPGPAPGSEPARDAPGPFDTDLEGDPSLADVEAAADRVAGAFAAASERPDEEPAAGDQGPEDSELEVPTPGVADRPSSPSRWLDEDFDEPGEPAPSEDDLVADLTETPQRRKVKVGDPEALLGPAWEDPTARTVGREPPGGPRAGRNIPLAVVSAAILAVVALFFVLISPWLFTILAGGVVLFAQYELYTTSLKRGYHPAIALGLVTGGLTVAAAYFKGEQAMTFMVALTAALTFLWYMASPAKARAGTVANIGLTVLGVVYLPFLASFIVLILTQANSGKGLMLSVLGLTFLYDVAAFLIGSWYGTHPLAPTISPKKSWEGLIGATVTTMVISIAFVSQVGPMTLPRAFGLALVVCVFAPLGDLAESTVKRDLGVKDMGSIMPGHGGLLDRIDSVLFVAPAAFYFLRVIF